VAERQDAQSLLDELAGRLGQAHVRSDQIVNPVGYLRSLIARADAGEFTSELGPAIAEARRRLTDRRREARPRRADPNRARLGVRQLREVLRGKNLEGDD
jgi:hypothetical protein